MKDSKKVIWQRHLQTKTKKAQSRAETSHQPNELTGHKGLAKQENEGGHSTTYINRVLPGERERERKSISDSEINPKRKTPQKSSILFRMSDKKSRARRLQDVRRLAYDIAGRKRK